MVAMRSIFGQSRRWSASSARARAMYQYQPSNVPFTHMLSRWNGYSARRTLPVVSASAFSIRGEWSRAHAESTSPTRASSSAAASSTSASGPSTERSRFNSSSALA
jgi:hypothetical protein